MADHHGTAGKAFQTFFERTEGVHVDIVGRFVEQEHVAFFLQGHRQVQTVTFTTREHTAELFLVGTREVEAAQVGTGIDIAAAHTDEVVATAHHLIDTLVQEELPALVKKAGGKYAFWFCQAYPPESGRNACGGIVYRKDRFKLTDKHIFWMSPTPDEPSKGWDEKKYYRIAASAIVFDKWTGKRFHFMYTHGPLGKTANANSAPIIIEREKMYNKDGLVSIFVGDMNARPNSPFVQTIRTHYKDAIDVAKGRTTVEGTFTGANEDIKNLSMPERRIDQIYIRSNNPNAYEVLYYDVNTNKYNVGDAVTFPSDHCPVSAKIRIK